MAIQKANIVHLSDILANFYIKDSTLYWVVDKDKHPIKDTPAGSIDSDGYLSVLINGKPNRAHRLIYQIYHNLDTLNPELKIDHKDRNKLNNSKENLQLVNCFENSHNLSMHPKNVSGYIGVHLRKSIGKWRATIASNRKIYELGCFTDIIEAAETYDIAAIRRDPNNHVLNFPEKKDKYLKFIEENGWDIGHDQPKKSKVQSGYKFITYAENKYHVKRWKFQFVKDGLRHTKFFPFNDEGLAEAIQWRDQKYLEVFGKPFQQ